MSYNEHIEIKAIEEAKKIKLEKGSPMYRTFILAFTSGYLQNDLDRKNGVYDYHKGLPY